MTAYVEPSGPGVRVDSGVGAGNEVSGAYDPMIAKLIVHGMDREHARMRMLRALDEFVIGGPKTLIGFHKALLSHDCFIRGETCHGLVESEEMEERAAALRSPSHRNLVSTRIAGRPAHARRRSERKALQRSASCSRSSPGASSLAAAPSACARAARAAETRSSSRCRARSSPSPWPRGTSRAGTVICIVEAMKMENEVRAHKDGVVAALTVSAGDAVGSGQAVCRIE